MCDSGEDTTPHELARLATIRISRISRNRVLLGYKGFSEWERTKGRGMLRLHAMAMGAPRPPGGFGLFMVSFVCGASHRDW